MSHFLNYGKTPLLIALLMWTGMADAAQPAPAIPQGPALELTVKYYDRSLTAEGVLREIHFEEEMLRRPGHIWVARVLPKTTGTEKENHAAHAHDAGHEHKHFNSVLLPRHVSLENDNIKLEYIDREERQVVNIVATEYENVNFDGSWINAYFLVDPQQVAAMPLSKKSPTVAGARWHEQEQNGVFQRVLWDDINKIPLEVETGKRDGTLFRKVSVRINSKGSEKTPWSNTQGYVHKEYSDFLD
jgi:hypothetical protein